MTNHCQSKQITIQQSGSVRKIPYTPNGTAHISNDKKPPLIGPYVHPVTPTVDSGGQKLVTSHQDRTAAYVRRMRPLTLLGGAAVAFALVTQGQIPLLSLAFVSVTLITSFIFLIIGEIIYQLVSPDGTNLFIAWLHHRRLLNEQKFIFADLQNDNPQNDSTLERTIIKILLIILIICPILLIILAIAETWI